MTYQNLFRLEITSLPPDLYSLIILVIVLYKKKKDINQT